MWLTALWCMAMMALPTSAASFSEPSTAKIYRIWNASYTSHVMFENTGNHTLNATTTVSSTDYSQLWLLEKVEGIENGYTLRNVQTGRYVQKVTQNETQYPTGNNPYTFLVVKNTHRTDAECYNLLHSADRQWSMHEASGQRIVRWYPTSGSEKNHPSEWKFEEVEKTQDMENHLSENQIITRGAYQIVNTQRKPGSQLFMYETGNNEAAVREQSAPSTDFSDLWLIRAKADNIYSLQNMKTGRYLQVQDKTYSTYRTDISPADFYIYRHTYAGTDAYWDIANKKENNWGCHADGQWKVVPWHPAEQGTVNASEWLMIPNTTLSDKDIKDQLARLNGSTTPVAGKYYRIVSHLYNRVLKDDYMGHNMVTETKHDGDYTQVWKVVANGAKFDLQNACTQKFIQKQSGAYSVPYTTGTNSNGGFGIIENTSDPYTLLFEMADDNGVGIHCAESQSYQPVGWYVGSDGNLWTFQEVTVNETALARSRSEYQEYVSLIGNADTFSAKLRKYFSDEACTKLNETYAQKDDAAITAEMNGDGLPGPLQAIVLKIKNNSWASYHSGTNWEQRFRIAEYKPYSDNTVWGSRVGVGYHMGNMTNPTGITAKSKNNIFVFVGRDVPQHASLEIEAIATGSATGQKTPLKKGLNIMALNDEANLYIRYIADTYDTGKRLADFPAIKIHIEGGSVNGYFDLTKNDTDETWTTLQSDGLLTAKAVNLKTKSIVFNMNSQKVKAACPVHMKGLLEIWESIVSSQEDLMGLEAKWADRCNCVLNATSVDHSYMYATTYGTYYEEGTLASVMNYDEMKQGGAIWGPAHEFGHNHQMYINMAGSTEVSNNLFSNVAVFNQGKFTSRGNGSSLSIAQQFVAGKHWAHYDIWSKTQLYYKLWLYFHAAGHDTRFYQTFFELLSSDPMSRDRNINGRDEYLKFAVKCSEAAKADLSELFEVYGFFVPCTNLLVDDYGEHYLTASQADIDEALQKIRSYGKPLGNIMFIDDHIRKSAATYEGAPAGATRENYDDEVAIGKMGDVGQWEDFKAENFKSAGASLANKYAQPDGSLKIVLRDAKAGTMGYKVYNGKGQLVYIANTHTFTIPAQVMKALNGTEPVLKAAAADGTDVLISGAGTGIAHTDKDESSGDQVSTYSLTGICMKKNVNRAEASKGLSKGIYFIDKKKVAVK